MVHVQMLSELEEVRLTSSFHLNTMRTNWSLYVGNAIQVGPRTSRNFKRNVVATVAMLPETGGRLAESHSSSFFSFATAGRSEIVVEIRFAVQEKSIGGKLLHSF